MFRFIAITVLAFLFFAITKLVLWDIPQLSVNNPNKTAFMQLQRHSGISTWIKYENIPTTVINMLIGAEDARFLEHDGVDWMELDRAINDFQKNGKKRGASTITMQLARNLYLSPQKSFLRKAVEILMALEMDLVLSKERILEIYLNVVEWGNGIFGIEAAARHYFHVPASKLSAQEASFLVAILPNPRGWGKWPPSGYVQRRMAVIQRRAGHYTSPQITSSVVTSAATAKKTGWEEQTAQPAEEIIDDEDMPAEIFLETD